MLWTDLKGIQEPLRVGDVVILPGELSPPRFSIVFKCSMRRADGMLYSDWFLPVSGTLGHREYGVSISSLSPIGGN